MNICKLRNSRSIFSFVLIALLFITFVEFGPPILAQDFGPVQNNPLNPEFVNYVYKNSIRGCQSFSVSAVQQPTGLIPLSVDVYSYLKPANSSGVRSMSVASSAGLPAQYDLRSLNRVTPVKDQGNCGSCWSFATYGSMESNLLPDESDDFSENNLKNTAGFDLGHSSGGNSLMSSAYLARWSGPINELDDPYNPASGISTPSLTVRKHVQDILFLPDRTAALDNAIIKQALQDYGAVYTTMYFGGSYYNPSRYAYYDPNQSQNNHAVTIVGWDDAFSRFSFGPYTPAGDGAFIIKNSWGTSWGDKGYFYISYYDVTVGKGNTVFLKPEPVNNFSHLYQYDPLGMVTSLGYGGNSAWMANVFNAVASDNLTAVSWYSFGMDSTYQIKIYTDANSDPTSGNLALTQSGTLHFPGYHTVRLATPTLLSIGHKFSVVIKVTSPDYTYPIPIEYPYYGYSNGATAHTGESFISSDGNIWSDLTGPYPNTNVCLKAFTSSGNNSGSLSITQQPSNQTVNLGGTATFTVSAIGNPIPTFQWNFNGIAIPGANTDTLVIPNVQLANVGSYSVTISNSQGSVNSVNAVLSLAAQRPVISGQPVNQAVNLGGTAVFKVTATGYPAPTYQWRFNNQNISGATSDTLIIPNVQPANIGSYSVNVRNNSGSLISSGATLSINSLPPVITAQPVNQQANLGGTASFTVTAAAYPAATYQWTFNQAYIPGATSASLTLTNVQPANIGNFAVIVTNSRGSVISNPAIISINNQKPAITSQPVSQKVNLGGTATFTVSATGYPEPAYQWSFNGIPIPGATSATLNILNAQPGNVGGYTVTVSNSQGTVTSANATLSINTIITTQPVNQKVNLGGIATFTVAATGYPAPTYQWKFNGITIPGATSTTLTVTNVQPANIGTYSVVASNGQSSVTSSSVILSINSQIPVISVQPVNQTVNLGGAAVFSVAAAGYPIPTYQWRLNEVAINGATFPSLTVNNVQAANAGNYSVIVSNSQGSIASIGADLKINYLSPAITVQPVSQKANLAGTASFTINAVGYPTPTYQWYFNGTPISGAKSVTLTLNNVQPSNIGNYSVTVSNDLGSVASVTAALSINGQRPVITLQPVNQKANWGGTATFTVSATGYPAPAYQWNFNGIPIPGATSIALIIPNAQSANVGSYSVTVSNAQGSVVSANATLGINTVITTQPVNQKVNLGETAVFSVTAVGYPAFTYQWKFNGNAISGATSDTLTIPNVQPANIGSYSVVVRNNQSSVNSVNASLGINSQKPVVINQPASQTTSLNGTIILTVKAAAYPTPNYQWNFNGAPISGATSESLKLVNVQAANVGLYSVSVTNKQGFVNSDSAFLNIFNQTALFSVQPINQAAKIGSNVTFTATATGYPTPTYQWYFGNEVIPGATSSKLSIQNIQDGNAGNYSVMATNSQGTIFSNAITLTILKPPTIFSQPASQTVNQGGTVSFTVVANGSPVPTYQWYRNGITIPGAIAATFSISNLKTANVGSYTVVVSNSLGSVKSDAATLSISQGITAVNK